MKRIEYRDSSFMINSGPDRKFIAGISALALGLSLTGFPLLTKGLVADYVVDNEFTNIIEYAVNDTDPVLAADRINQAKVWMVEQGLSEGSSCFYAERPDCNRAEFYRKLTQTEETLRSIVNEDELTKSNTFIRIRESLLTRGDSGESVNHPNLSLPLAYGSANVGWWISAYAWIASIIGGFLIFIIFYAWIKS